MIVAKGGDLRRNVAMTVPFGSVVDGIAEANADQYYRVEINGGQLTVDADTTALDSRWSDSCSSLIRPAMKWVAAVARAS